MDTSTTYPDVSIILPTYNRARYILETIRSVQGQTFQNWELIIMDDGSNDNTEKLVEDIADARIKLQKRSHTGMVSSLKNEAIRLSRGEFVAFIDSDDTWDPAKLQKQVHALQQYDEAGFSLVGGYTFRNSGQPIHYFYPQREGSRFGNIFTAMFRSEIAGFTQALLLRKKCVDVAGFFDETKNFSDPDFLISLARHFKAVVLFEPLLFRRLHASSDSNEYWEQRYLEWIDVIVSYRRQKLLPRQVSRQALFKLFINYGEKCLLLKRNRSAFHRFFNAWQQRPWSIVPYKKMVKASLARLKGE